MNTVVIVALLTCNEINVFMYSTVTVVAAQFFV